MFGGYVTADIRYLYGITKVNSKKTAYANENIAFDYNWGDSVFKLNSLTISVGYIQNIFKPKKLSRKKWDHYYTSLPASFYLEAVKT